MGLRDAETEPPVMHCDEAAAVLALTSGDSATGIIRVFDLDTLQHLYTLLPPDMNLPSAMHASGDFVATGCFSGSIVVLESMDERKKGQQILVPAAKQDAVRPTCLLEDDESDRHDSAKSGKKGGKKPAGGMNRVADAAAAAASIVKRSLSPVRSPRLSKGEVLVKTAASQHKVKSHDLMIKALLGIILAVLAGLAGLFLASRTNV